MAASAAVTDAFYIYGLAGRRGIAFGYPLHAAH